MRRCSAATPSPGLPPDPPYLASLARVFGDGVQYTLSQPAPGRIWLVGGLLVAAFLVWGVSIAMAALGAAALTRLRQAFTRRTRMINVSSG
jgi:hypothetical protein